MRQTKIFSRMALIALTLTAISLCTACSNDADTLEIPDNTKPEFSDGTGTNPRFYSEDRTAKVGSAEVRRDPYGCITWIIFNNQYDAPATSADLLTTYMNLDLNENFRLRYSDTMQQTAPPLSVESYQQQYKGVIVADGGYNVRFQNGKVTSANGNFIKVDNLDVQPSFGLDKAKEIYARYLGVTVDEISDTGIDPWFDDKLFIVEFPVRPGSADWAPRLVYGLYYDGLSDEGTCYIDAHTGRLLTTGPNYYTVIPCFDGER